MILIPEMIRERIEQYNRRMIRDQNERIMMGQRLPIVERMLRQIGDRDIVGGYIDRKVKRIISPIDPYGEENWEQ